MFAQQKMISCPLEALAKRDCKAHARPTLVRGDRGQGNEPFIAPLAERNQNVMPAGLLGERPLAGAGVCRGRAAGAAAAGAAASAAGATGLAATMGAGAGRR